MQNDTTYFGAIVGRVANRIKGAQFKLNGHTYKLVPNEGKNMLHGGPKGYADVVWEVTKYQNKGHKPHIVFSYHSFDGEEGSWISVSLHFFKIKIYSMSIAS